MQIENLGKQKEDEKNNNTKQRRFNVVKKKVQEKNNPNLTFEEVRALVHKYKFKSIDEWKKFVTLSKTQKQYKCSDGVYRPTKPYYISPRPKENYEKRGEWTSWEDFLNIPVVPTTPRLMSYDEAKAFIHPLGLKNEYEWYDWWEANKPPRLNKRVSHYMANKTWISW